MIEKTTLGKFLRCQIFLFSLLSSGIVCAQTGSNDDFDGDGIINSIDLDDDNDGVPDAVENPTCFYSAAEIAVPASITTTVANSGTIANLYDNNPSTVFNFTNGTSKTNLTVFEITPIRPVAATGIQIEMNSDGQTEFSNTASSLTVEGWNGTAWITLLPAFNPSTAPNSVLGYFQTFNFTQNQTTSYSRFRLQGLAGTIVASQMKEVKLLIPGNYLASLYPKASCTDANIDGDNILNQFDLDSDGDGCSDALESGATAIITANYQFPDVDSNNDGLVDAVDSNNDGIVNYESTYTNYAIVQSLNGCADSDGDGIKDVADLDDDNDGIPDIVECSSGFQSIISEGIKNLTESLPAGVNSSNALYSQYGLIIRERNKIAPYNIARNEFNIVSHTGDSDNEYIYRTDAIAQSFEFYNPVSNQKRSFDRIQISAEPATDGSILTLVAFDENDNVIFTNTYPDGSTMSVNTSQTLNNSKIHRFIVSGSLNTTGFDQLFVQGLSTFVGNCDTDGDTVANHLDLDSDGDGCSDRVESGVSPLTDVITPSATNNVGGSYGIANPAGAQLNPLAADANNDGLNDSVDTDQNGSVNYVSSYRLYALSAGINACTDTDGDGIADLIDIDDDNDGVLDAVESPSCFYTVAEAGTVAVVSTPLANDDGVNVDLPFMHDGVTTSIAASNNVITVNGAANGAVIYNLEYPTPVKLTSISHYGGTFGTSATAKIQGSNDKMIWDELMTAPTAATANPKVFTVNNNAANSYRYYRIVKVAGTTTPAITSYEISSVQNTADYNPSMHPKATCTDANIDGDNIPPHHDLDTDGDGCSDSVEAGNTPYTSNNTTTFNTGTDANGNGLLDQFENGTTGTINYTSTYNLYATNTIVSVCADTDGDGIRDIIDIDDDNDGITDVIENGSCTSLLEGIVDGSFESAAGVAWEESTNTGSLNSTLGPTGWTPTNSPDTWKGGFSLNGVGNWGGAMNGVPPTPDGNIFAAIYNGFLNEAISTEVPVSKGVQVGETYFFEFNQIFGGVNGVTTVGQQAQLRFTIDGVVYLSNMMTYNGNNVKSWEKSKISFVATSTSPNITIDVLAGGDGNYLGIDGIILYKENTQGCAGVPRDTDGDGVPNYLDLDSDGDGCSDLAESNVSPATDVSTPSSTTNNNGTSYGIAADKLTESQLSPAGTDTNNDGLNDSVDPDLNGQTNYISTYNIYAIDGSLNVCADEDGDGISDLIEDIDDDNDGIPDAVESPTCFYTEAESNAALTITSQFVSPDNTELDNDMHLLHDGSTTATFNFNAYSVAENPTGSNLFTIKYPTPVRISSITVSDDISSTSGANAVVVGSNDGINWSTPLTTTPVVITTTPIVFTINPSPAYLYYRIQTGSVPGALATTNTIGEITVALTNYIASYHPKANCFVDTDGDGIPNRLDLDSDGDGCSDAYEGGATTNTAPNYEFTGAMGTNGLEDSLETSVDSGAVNYTSTYSRYALNSTLNLCTDTDGDGVGDLIDIDDDNDGVLDAAEISCAVSTTNKTGIIVTKPATIDYIFDGTQTLANLVDGVDANDYIIRTPTGTLTNSEWFRIELPVAKVLTYWEVGHYSGQSLFTTSSIYKVQGSNDGASWDDLTGTLTYSNTQSGLSSQTSSNIAEFPNNNIAYKYYRYYGLGTAASQGTWATEFYFKEKNCVELDTDGDGIPNRLDLDSDGDGCPDAVESGVSANAGASGSMSASGGAIYSGGIATGTANAYVGNGTPSQYGTNGYFNGIETSSESGVYNGTSTYTQYALANNLSICAQTDTDGINDIVDIDDDNDGILDAVESPSCFYTAAEIAIPNSITSEIPTTGTIANLYDNNTATTFAFTATTAANAKQKAVFEIIPKYQVAATSITLKTNAATTSIFGTYSANAVIKAQGWNGTAWVDLATFTTNPTIAANLQTFAFTNTTVYSKYRLYDDGSTGVNITAGVLQEVVLGIPASYIPSAHPKPTCAADFDGDGIFNHLDSDSDNDGCSDAFEAGTATYSTSNGGTVSSGTLDNPSNTISPNATVGSNAPSDYGANGFYNILETSENGIYLGTYTYANAINNAIANCIQACYRPAVVAGTALDTRQGITSLQRAGSDNDNWPMVRKGAWTALESKTKGFVPNRLTAQQITDIPAANLREGMMVYNITSDCLYINTDGTPTGWKCFNTQACPD